MKSKKVIVITGDRGGLGKALVDHFLKKGWDVIGISKRDTDISNYKAVSDTFAEIAKNYGKIDVLVNNAAVFKSELLEECEPFDVHQIIDTNLKGAIFCTMEAYSLIPKGGRIINIGSVAGEHGIAKQSLYCASKHGLKGFFQALQLENKDVLISTINPGGIDTPLWNEKNPYPGYKSDLLKPKDIAELVGFIADLPSNAVFKEATLYPINEEH